MNRNILIVLIIIFLIILAGIIAFSQFATKEDSKLTFISNASLKNGDMVEFQLTDTQGNVIANQNISISFGANGTYEQHSIITDNNGKGALLLNDEEPGNYNVNVTYAGSEQYNGCSASQNMTIIASEAIVSSDYVPSENANSYTPDGTPTGQTYSDGSSSSGGYDSELNVHYDSEGKVVGGQNDGADYAELKNNKPNTANGDLE